MKRTSSLEVKEERKSHPNDLSKKGGERKI